MTDREVAFLVTAREAKPYRWVSQAVSSHGIKHSLEVREVGATGPTGGPGLSSPPGIHRQTRFRADSRWSTPEMDALIDRYLATIPKVERMAIVRQIMTEVMEVLPIFPMFYSVEPTMVSNRLRNVGGRMTPYTQDWNAHEWTVQ